jgi:hypothetical protein
MKKEDMRDITERTRVKKVEVWLGIMIGAGHSPATFFLYTPFRVSYIVHVTIALTFQVFQWMGRYKFH